MDYLTFQVTLAIRLSLQIYTEASYVQWANDWLSNKDRSKKAAHASAYAAHAYAASYAAYAASYAAAAYAHADAYAYAASSIKASIKWGAEIEKVVSFLP